MTLARDSKPPRELAAAVFDAIFEEAPKPACPTCNGTGWVYACKSVADGSNLLEPCPACLNRHTASPDARMVAAGAIRPEAVEREEQAARLFETVSQLPWSVASREAREEWLAVRDAAAAMFAAPPATLTAVELATVREALRSAHEWGAKFPLRGMGSDPDRVAAQKVYADTAAALALLTSKAGGR